jgi:membrane associated rhomboid family serine protease
MFIIPIGTASSLALKPKLTIGLIAANVLVAIVTIPLMIVTGGDLFMVQRVRYAREIKLYLEDQKPGTILLNLSGTSTDQLLDEVERAKDSRSFQVSIFRAMSASGITAEDLTRFEETLGTRDRTYYAGSANEEIFGEWERLRAREQAIIDGSVLNRFGLIPSKMNRVYTLFTHLFVHAGIWHLAGNMLFLWVVGCLLEDSWGRIPFLLFFIAGGLVAGVVHCLQDTSSGMPLVGASGAIAAAMGAFAVRHFRTKIKFFYFFLLFIRPYAGTFFLPAFVFLPLWFIEQLVMHHLNGYFGGGSNVAYMAHIAGFSAGVFAAVAMRMTGFEERFLAPSVKRKQVAEGVTKDPRFEQACALLEKGNNDSARLLFNKLLAERSNDVDLIQDIALLYREKGFTEDYASLTERTLKLMILDGRLEEASRFALDVVREGTVMLNPQYLLRIAKWLADRELYGEAHDLYRSVIAPARPPHVRSKAYVALAKLLSDKMGDHREALALLEEARRMPLDAAWIDMIAEIEQEISGGKSALHALQSGSDF